MQCRFKKINATEIDIQSSTRFIKQVPVKIYRNRQNEKDKIFLLDLGSVLNNNT